MATDSGDKQAGDQDRQADTTYPPQHSAPHPLHSFPAPRQLPPPCTPARVYQNNVQYKQTDRQTNLPFQTVSLFSLPTSVLPCLFPPPVIPAKSTLPAHTIKRDRQNSPLSILYLPLPHPPLPCPACPLSMHTFAATIIILPNFLSCFCLLLVLPVLSPTL